MIDCSGNRTGRTYWLVLANPDGLVYLDFYMIDKESTEAV